MSCVATLAADVVDCVGIDAEVAGRLGQRWPLLGVSRTADLQRARLGVGISDGPAAARLAFGAVRSGGEQGYVGVDGESIVPRVEVASARAVARPRADLDVLAEAGLIADAWVHSTETAWRLSAVGPVFGLSSGLVPRSDLGGRLALITPFLTVAADATAGEGLSRRERNDGKDLSALIEIRPLAERDAVSIAAFAREGSRGIDRARDHRLAGRVSGHAGIVDAGVEVIAAWGYEGDALVSPLGASAWTALEGERFTAFARVDGVLWGTTSESGSGTTRLGGGVPLVARGERRGHVLLTTERGVIGEDAYVLPGAAPLGWWSAVYVSLDVDVGIDLLDPFAPR